MGKKARDEFKRRDRSYRPRRIATREPIPAFLIVCEGQKTEPNYFRSFRVPSLVLEVEGIGYNTISLVEHAIARQSTGAFQKVWCVFDRDSFPAQNFNAAIARAHAHGISVAYTNEAFELWYLLHFEYCTSGITRADYVKKLSKLLGRGYSKNDPSIFVDLAPHQEKAVANAKRLLATYDPPHPCQDNPSTTVHVLVEELNRFAS